MPTSIACPHCSGTLSLLAVISSISLADYYVCAVCGKLSERPKGASGVPVPILLPVAPEPGPHEGWRPIIV
jgi:DNA-directed RNA polymerase subunit RPC12/RpoP